MPTKGQLPDPHTMEIYGLPPVETVIEYLVESQHQSWDGFSARNKTAIRAMIKDMWLYHKASLEDAERRKEEQ